MPRVLAHSVCQCLLLAEDTLTAAMQQDEQLTTNLWWARCQRETFCLLRKLEPFCWWQASKLWQWVALGRHIKVPEGRGQLGAQAPFVVLVHGKCHISYQEHMHDNGDSAGARYSIDGQRRRLGSMKLLGSGAKIADLLTFHTKNAKPTGKESPLTTPHGTPTNGGGGKWVPGPDVVHCHEEISYHFSRDSLVFIPSERGTCTPTLALTLTLNPSPSTLTLALALASPYTHPNPYLKLTLHPQPARSGPLHWKQLSSQRATPQRRICKLCPYYRRADRGVRDDGWRRVRRCQRRWFARPIYNEQWSRSS